MRTITKLLGNLCFLMLMTMMSACGTAQTNNSGTSTISKAMHPGLSTTNSTNDAGLHLGLAFNGNMVADTTPSKIGVNDENKYGIDYVWGSYVPNKPAGVYNTSYHPYDRIGNDPKNGTTPLHSLQWFKTNHPDWIEYQCSNDPNPDTFVPATESGADNTPLDITNPDVLQFLMQNEYMPEIHRGYPGLAFDNVDFWNTGHRCGHFDTNKKWVPQFSGQSHESQFEQAVVTWAKDIYTRCQKLNVSVSMNFSYDTTNTTSEQMSDQILQHMDILSDEQGFTRSAGQVNSNSNIGPYLTDEPWVKDMNAIRTFQDSRDGGVFLINQEPSTTITNDQMQWALANYLLIQGAHSYVTVVGPQQYTQFYDHPEYHAAKVGAPIGAKAKAVGSTCTGDVCVYERVFSHGLVFVNPSSMASSIVSLEGASYHDLYGHATQEGSVTLPPDTGIVLLLEGPEGGS